MAGDWIKMRVDLQDDPSVVALCDHLDLDEFQVIGRLHKLWGWADTHTADGVTSGVTPRWVDRYVSHQGFAEALISVGWLCFEDGILRFPGFNIHNGASAKSRCDATIRKRVSRERHAGVTNGGDNLPAIPRPFVRAVLNRDSYTCVYCGTKSDAAKEQSKKSVLSIDHIIPASRGSGRQAIEDLATCCKQCNNEKNDRTPEEWGVLPSFLSLDYEYKNGVVTKICDNTVTREEKRREENTNTHIDSANSEFLKDPEFVKLFEAFKDSSRYNHHWSIAESTCEAWLMGFYGKPIEEAKEILRQSTMAGAKKPIFNSVNRTPQKTQSTSDASSAKKRELLEALGVTE